MPRKISISAGRPASRRESGATRRRSRRRRSCWRRPSARRSSPATAWRRAGRWPSWSSSPRRSRPPSTSRAWTIPPPFPAAIRCSAGRSRGWRPRSARPWINTTCCSPSAATSSPCLFCCLRPRTSASDHTPEQQDHRIVRSTIPGSSAKAGRRRWRSWPIPRPTCRKLSSAVAGGDVARGEGRGRSRHAALAAAIAADRAASSAEARPRSPRPASSRSRRSRCGRRSARCCRRTWSSSTRSFPRARACASSLPAMMRRASSACGAGASAGACRRPSSA